MIRLGNLFFPIQPGSVMMTNTETLDLASSEKMVHGPTARNTS